MSVRDSYHVENINARRLVIKTNVNSAQRMLNRSVDVVKTQRLCHAIQSITQKNFEMKLWAQRNRKSNRASNVPRFAIRIRVASDTSAKISAAQSKKEVPIHVEHICAWLSAIRLFRVEFTNAMTSVILAFVSHVESIQESLYSVHVV